MSNKKRHIRIHPDHIEDLDKKWEEAKKHAKEPERTGYKSMCKIRNTKWNRDILFTKKFVEEKMKTMTFMIFHPIGKDKTMMIQPVPAEWIKRTSVCHIQERTFQSLRIYGFSAEMDKIPEPAGVLFQLGISPIAKGYTFELEEYKIQDEIEGEIMAYKLIPMHA